jgi:hypothetical protein
MWKSTLEDKLVVQKIQRCTRLSSRLDPESKLCEVRGAGGRGLELRRRKPPEYEATKASGTLSARKVHSHHSQPGITT